MCVDGNTRRRHNKRNSAHKNNKPGRVVSSVLHLNEKVYFFAGKAIDAVFLGDEHSNMCASRNVSKKRFKKVR